MTTGTGDLPVYPLGMCRTNVRVIPPTLIDSVLSPGVAEAAAPQLEGTAPPPAPVAPPPLPGAPPAPAPVPPTRPAAPPAASPPAWPPPAAPPPPGPPPVSAAPPPALPPPAPPPAAGGRPPRLPPPGATRGPPRRSPGRRGSARPLHSRSLPRCSRRPSRRWSHRYRPPIPPSLRRCRRWRWGCRPTRTNRG